MWVIQHANNVYRMLNLKTKKIVNTRDVVWLGKCYKEWSNKKVASNERNLDEENEDFIENAVTLNPRLTDTEVDQVPGEPEKGKDKLYRQMKLLESSFNPEASKIIENIEQGREIILNQANVALFSGGIQVEPTTFSQAWDHHNPMEREKWRIAIKKEFSDMESKKVWKQLRKKMFQWKEEQSSASGSLRSREMEFFVQDLLHVDTARFLALTSTKASPLSSTM